MQLESTNHEANVSSEFTLDHTPLQSPRNNVSTRYSLFDAMLLLARSDLLDLDTMVALSSTCRCLYRILLHHPIWKRSLIRLGYGRSTAARDSSVSWRTLACSILAHSKLCLACSIVYDKQRAQARMRRRFSDSVQLIEGISYSRLRKFLGWFRTSSLPLIAIKGENIREVCVDISLSLQRILLHRNTMLYGATKAKELDSDANVLSISHHVAISSLLVASKPIQAAQVMSRWEYPERSEVSDDDIMPVDLPLTEVYNPDGLTISDITGIFAGNPPTAIRRVSLPFLGVKLDVESDSSFLEDERTSIERQAAVSDPSNSRVVRGGERDGKEGSYLLDFVFGPVYSYVFEPNVQV